ncbi:cell division protein FtsQ/DivIB [Sphingobium algorifonticola]|uniref:Cell division protein FtsQ n=1 Tax=Sphingobium algorifonticola TaxID=2008318 RepID=A0A437J989_9SPHN|nr:cell division protein FtsQ/DivIB [Sphingobium algorifonticola]RVT42048.1 FtsQ-type POTRA domain-containing protein [Sphingobium algorifonticola]
MSDARIRRGNTSRLSPRGSSSTGNRAPSRSRALKKRSRLDRIVAMLPFSHATLQRLISGSIVATVGGAAVLAANFLGLPAMARMEFASAMAKAGFEVAKVEVHGVERMDELAVYTIALGQVDRSMVKVDLPKLRQDLMTLGWVKDARVSRRLPDTLVVDIVERQPVAVWQHAGRLDLIDVTGTVLQSVSLSDMPDLPLVVGPNANRQTARLGILLDAAPALKPLLAGATWIGDRRWDLRFQSGETLLLPEGEAEAAAALVNFARMDGSNRLLGRGIVRFDMRDPDKFVLRLPQDRATKDEKADDRKIAIASRDGEV